jgi:hypothetical protein
MFVVPQAVVISDTAATATIRIIMLFTQNLFNFGSNEAKQTNLANAPRQAGHIDPLAAYSHSSTDRSGWQALFA